MNRRQSGAAVLARFFVWTASAMVPAAARREWAAEWQAELHHVCAVRTADAIPFSLGAFRDAFCLTFDPALSRTRSLFSAGSAPRCLAGLATLAVCGLLACLLLPGARQALSSEPYRNPADLVVISSDGYAGTQSPSISLADYREWRTDTSHLFTQLAFYRPIRTSVQMGRDRVDLPVALATPNLPRVLGSSAWQARSLTAARPRLFVKQSVWSGSDLIGSTVLVGGESAIIAGVIPDGQWRLPGGAEAVLVEDTHQLTKLPGGARGFAIARIRSSAFHTDRNGWRFMFEVQNGAFLQFECFPFASIFTQPLSIFLIALLIACLSLPATTPLRLGDYPERRGELLRRSRLRRWLFLLAKLVLMVPIVGFGSIACAYACSGIGSSQALCIQMGTTFLALLFAFRWTFHDQRRRCPVCLRSLSNPARVGQPSCIFLAWCGTEWICQNGHGLLHIPELPTCWFSTQRWLCLDASWAGLFPADPAAP